VPTSSRMLTLLSLLQTRRDWPGHLLAERLQISERTVRRDVDRLRELGYRVQAVMGPDGGYRLDAGSELPPLLFDDEQAIAIAVALQTVPAIDGGFEEAALRALATVRQVMPVRLRHRVDALDVTALPAGRGGSPVGGVDRELLMVVGGAVRAREVLRFDYAAPASGRAGTDVDRAIGGGDAVIPPPRRVEPHHLVTHAGRWYLVAWDLDRDDWRIFRVDRITPRTHTGPRFAPRELPGGDVRTFVAGRFKGTTGADAWPCEGEVIIHLPAHELAPYVGDGVVEVLAEDRCRLVLGAWSWNALAATFGRLDGDLEVVGPPELTAAFTRLARRFASAGHPAG